MTLRKNLYEAHLPHQSSQSGIARFNHPSHLDTGHARQRRDPARRVAARSRPEGDGDVAIDWHKIGDAYVIGVPRSLVDDSPVLLLQHLNQFVPAGCPLPPMGAGFSGSSPNQSIVPANQHNSVTLSVQAAPSDVNVNNR